MQYPFVLQTAVIINFVKVRDNSTPTQWIQLLLCPVLQKTNIEGLELHNYVFFFPLDSYSYRKYGRYGILIS